MLLLVAGDLFPGLGVFAAWEEVRLIERGQRLLGLQQISNPTGR
jgi:hypothetical protein